MAFDPIRGLSMTGTQIPIVSPNMTKDQQTAVINQMVEVLNNYSRDVVASGTVNFPLDGTAQVNVLTIPHNLGYKPQARCYLNNISLTIAVGSETQVYSNVDLTLPTYIQATGIGVGGEGDPVVDFFDWMDYFVDDKNLYIHFINANSVTGNVPITYALTRNPSNAQS